MALNVKELLVVLVIAGVFFWFAKPVALTFMPPADFVRRRTAWFVLTIVAFLSPTFWVFVAVAIPILLVAGRRDSNPVAVYLMLLSVTPPIGKSIPMLFMIDNFFLLSFCILTPAAIRILRAKHRPPYRNLMWIDLTLLTYGIFISFHYLQAQSVSGALFPITTPDSIKRVFLFVITTYVPYFVASRSNATRLALIDSIATYCFVCALLASIGCFESVRSWLLYSEMPARLGITSGFAEYLIRGYSLRAKASAGDPLTLATLLSIAAVLWLYLRPKIQPARVRLGISILLAAGLFVTYSRGPWIGAATGCLVYVLLRPGGASTILKTIVGVSLAAAGLSLTPLGDKIISLVPIFGGTTDIGTLIYRERLFNQSIAVISHHLFIGDTMALLEMQNLRQGEGIIDLVNVYIQILLSGGIVGLALLLGFLVLGVAKANSVRRRLLHYDPDMATLGASLIGCVAGLSVTLAAVSLHNAESMYFMLGAFAAAYAVSASVPSSTQKANVALPRSPSIPESTKARRASGR